MIPQRDINGIRGEDFITAINNAYNEIFKWRKNLFKLPSGNAAKKFVNELSKWLEHYNNNTQLQGIALKVFHILPALILQKPTKNSKARDHLKKLEQRLEVWNNADIPTLFSTSYPGSPSQNL